MESSSKLLGPGGYEFYKPEVFHPVHLRVSEFRSCFKPNKEALQPKKSMYFKKDLLDFQKAKNEEKIPRKYGVMAQFSKPVKPVLQLPNLVSHRFNLSQTK